MRTFAKRVVHIGSTSSTLALLIRVKSLSGFVVFQQLSNPQQRSALTVMPMSSSARMRAAYDAASSELDIVRLCIGYCVFANRGKRVGSFVVCSE